MQVTSEVMIIFDHSSAAECALAEQACASLLRKGFHRASKEEDADFTETTLVYLKSETRVISK